MSLEEKLSKEEKTNIKKIINDYFSKLKTLKQQEAEKALAELEKFYDKKVEETISKEELDILIKHGVANYYAISFFYKEKRKNNIRFSQNKFLPKVILEAEEEFDYVLNLCEIIDNRIYTRIHNTQKQLNGYVNTLLTYVNSIEELQQYFPNIDFSSIRYKETKVLSEEKRIEKIKRSVTNINQLYGITNDK